MNKKHFTQNDIDDDETIEWTDNPHYASELSNIITGLILLPFGIGILILISSYIRINYTTYALTDTALYQKKGLFSDEVKRVPLERIQNTEYTRSWTEKQFGFGTVQISTAGSGGNELSFNSVPNPELIQDNINKYIKENKKDENQTKDDGDIANELKQTRKNLEEIIELLN